MAAERFAAQMRPGCAAASKAHPLRARSSFAPRYWIVDSLIAAAVLGSVLPILSPNGGEPPPSRNRDYRQPDSRSHAARARGLAFSHCVMERVSLLSIFSFMQMQ